jgi:TRAP-type mannitol/chloroaromatic compound transport system permease small subunit
MRTLGSFIRIVDLISEWSGRIVSVLIPCMAAVLVFEVISRYAFDSPTAWAHETSIFMFGYCGALAGAYVLKYKSHVNVDVIYSRLSPRVKAILDLITALIFFYFIGLVIFKGWETAWTALVMNQHSSSSWGPPVAHFRFVIPVAGFLIILQGLANWLRNLYFAIKNRELVI